MIFRFFFVVCRVLELHIGSHWNCSAGVLVPGLFLERVHCTQPSSRFSVCPMCHLIFVDISIIGVRQLNWMKSIVFFNWVLDVCICSSFGPQLFLENYNSRGASVYCFLFYIFSKSRIHTTRNDPRSGRKFRLFSFRYLHSYFVLFIY